MDALDCPDSPLLVIHISPLIRGSAQTASDTLAPLSEVSLSPNRNPGPRP